MGTSAGTARSAGSAASASATQHTAQPTFRDGFASSSSSSQAATSSFFSSSASMSASASAFPFSVPGRPMDSRIKDACAMGFMGINLDSASGSAQDASSSSQVPPPGTASGSATAGRGAATAVPSSSATAGWGSATAGSSTFTGLPPPAFSHFQPSLGNAFRSGSANGDEGPSANHQVPQGAPPPSPFSFNLGTEPTPKPKTSRAMFGSEHVATNLHDKLVLEEEDSPAGAEPAATTGTASAPQAPSQQHQYATSAGMSAASSAAATNADAVPPAAAPVAPASAAASASASGSFGFPAFKASTSAAPAAAQPSFVFGAKPAAAIAAAASVSQPSQQHTFSFGTAAGSSGFPPGPPNPSAPSMKPFVFGAKASAATAQAAANSTFPPPGASQATAQEGAASVSTGLPHLSGQSAASLASAAAQSMPTHASAVPRNVLHSPSGIAKHTGPGRHGRAVPGSPGARRSARASPAKQVIGDDRPAGLPNRWTPVQPLGDPSPAPQAWQAQTVPSAHEQAGVTGRQHQVKHTALNWLCACSASFAG